VDQRPDDSPGYDDAMSRKGWALFLAMGFIWGVPYLCIRVAVGDGGISPASLVLARCVLGTAILLPVAAVQGRLRGLLPYWKPLLAFAAVEIAIPWMLLSSAETRLSSSLAGLLIAATPLVGAVLGWVTGRDRLGVRRFAGLGVGILGVAALVGLDLSADDAWALAAMAVVVVCYAVGPFILDRYLKPVPGNAVMAVALGLSAVAYAPAGIAQWPHRFPGAGVIAAVVVLGVLCTAIALTTFNLLIAEVGPARATVITYINPAVAILLGVVLLDEPFTAGIVVGFALVLVGSVLATYKDSQATKDPEMTEDPEAVTTVEPVVVE
jgi:drug/metabolite transporter (DMT)-like permease